MLNTSLGGNDWDKTRLHWSRSLP